METTTREVVTLREIKSYTVKMLELEHLRIVLQTIHENFSDKIVWIILDEEYKEEISNRSEEDEVGMTVSLHDGSTFVVKDGFVIYAKEPSGERMFVQLEGQPEIIIFVEKYSEGESNG